jgi:hypothetical protein
MMLNYTNIFADLGYTIPYNYALCFQRNDRTISMHVENPLQALADIRRIVLRHETVA